VVFVFKIFKHYKLFYHVYSFLLQFLVSANIPVTLLEYVFY